MMRKNKYIIIAFLLSVMYISPLIAQVKQEQLKEFNKNYCEWGILAGANFEQLTAYPFTNSYGTGGTLGGYVKRRKKTFGISGAITLTSAHYLTDYPASHSFVLNKLPAGTDTVSKGDFNTYYINVPVMVEYRPGKCFAMQMGASYSNSILLTDNNNAFKNAWNTDKIFKNNNISAIVGLELAITEGFRFYANYSIGFMDLNNLKFNGIADKWGVSNGQVGLSLRLKKWYPKHF